MTMTNEEEDPETEEKEVSKADQITEDPVAAQDREIQELSGKVRSLHDMVDRVKDTGYSTSEMLIRKAEEAETEELKAQYLDLADKARLAYHRIEYGDTTIVRGGL